MQQAKNDGKMTSGIFMAVVCDHPSAEDTTNSQHDVPLAFCLTANGKNNSFIVTPEMVELSEMGYSAIAVLCIGCSSTGPHRDSRACYCGRWCHAIPRSVRMQRSPN
jgi:hypothetical protein